jgi:D-lyxose ketol-isomerase
MDSIFPPFAYWSARDWKCKGEEARELVENQLGWDITDFGGGRFDSVGLFLFTIRNGSLGEMRERRGKLYCEKLMIVGVDQVTPTHFHWNKVEDIINRRWGKASNPIVQRH